MAASVRVSEFHQVLTLLERMLLEQGLAQRKVAAWMSSAALQHAESCREQKAAWFVELREGRPVGMAGAVICEDHAFLSLRSSRHGRIVDEYVLPAYRGEDITDRLRAAALAWLGEQRVSVRHEAAPNASRLAASAGCLRL